MLFLDCSCRSTLGLEVDIMDPGVLRLPLNARSTALPSASMQQACRNPATFIPDKQFAKPRQDRVVALTFDSRVRYSWYGVQRKPTQVRSLARIAKVEVWEASID